jgi:polyisoprenyl-teichoic acid--peptidoglycan teichoic acid transferase
MGIFSKRKRQIEVHNRRQGQAFYQKRIFWVFAVLIFAFLLAGGGFLYKSGAVLSKISGGKQSALKSLLGVAQGDEIKQEGDGRTNILLLGVRGTNILGGDLLSDVNMVVSLKKDEDKIALVSIPRDLYVKIPGSENSVKINAVHAYGEQGGKNEGLEQMKKAVGQITGMNIHYAASINFTGFKQLIDAVEGVDVNLETPFYEVSQFVQGNECGGEFTLPAGTNHLDGETALCYVRARENTSDFDRAKRQQVVLQALKDKMISLGTLTDFGKLSKILSAVGDNVKSDIPPSEMRGFFDKYAGMQNAQIYQRVLENTEEGLLTVPTDIQGAGYILVPRAGTYDYSQIQGVCKDIFAIARQSDVDPIKQYAKPQRKIRTIAVKVIGKIDAPEKYRVEVSQKISQIEIEGNYSEDQVTIDLGKLPKIKEEGTINFKVEDLSIPEGTKVISHMPTKTVLKIEILK